MDRENAETLEETANWSCRPEEERLHRAGKILLVEDEEFVRQVACEVLLAAGYSVLRAKNATEALCTFDQQPEKVALLLTDVVLPGENGQALARKLRNGNPHLKVLFVTGYPDRMVSRATEQEEFLAKPFSTPALLKSVAQLLDQDEFGLRKIKEDKEALFRRACGKA
jgi:two-component system, cell cycle sensor histidine kinase and response regulator CckA